MVLLALGFCVATSVDLANKNDRRSEIFREPLLWFKLSGAIPQTK